MFGIFSALAIFISSLGLFGLVLITSTQRTKEIGIRKDNGPSISEIMNMLILEFVKLIAKAFVIAIPFAFYAANQLLRDFAYRTNLSWWIFASAGILVALLSLATIGYQSWKISRTNPVDSLRSE